jgi:hypothetical protein
MSVIELESAGTRVVVNPSRGGDIISFHDGRIGGEVLWRKAGLEPDEGAAFAISQDTQDFYDNYKGGIQELFPNTADGTRVLGAELPFHGELCRTRLNVTRQTATTIELAGELKRYPILVKKAVSLTSSGDLIITTQLTNSSRFDLPYSWGLHPVFSEYFTGDTAELSCKARAASSHPAKFSDRQVYNPGLDVQLFDVGDSQVLQLVEARNGSADLIYIELKEPWFLLGKAGQFRVKVSWDNPDFDCLWVWQECHSPEPWPWWGQHHIVGVEPHTSFPAVALEEHVSKGTSQILPGGASASSRFLFQLQESFS